VFRKIKLKFLIETFRLAIILLGIFFMPNVIRAEDSSISDLPELDTADQEDPLASPNAISSKIDFSCEDSINIVLDNKDLFLSGNAEILYDEAQLKAEKITFNWEKNNLSAYKGANQLGEVQEVFFKEKEDVYLIDQLHYNIDSKKAICHNFITKQFNSIADFKYIKKVDDSEFYIKEGSFTTCKLKDRHFNIFSKKAKLLKGKKVITGPFNLHFREVPSPLGFFFGIFPASKELQSGILFPDFGLSSSSEFYLNKFGYYLAINDYLGLALTASFESEYGTFSFTPTFSYAKRYKYNGMLNYRWQDNSTGIRDENIHELIWEHATIKSWGSVLKASVHLKNRSSSNIATLGKRPVYDSLTKKEEVLKSFINYKNKDLLIFYNFNSSFSYEHNFTNKNSKLVFPNVSLASSKIFPLKLLSKKNTYKGWQENLSFDHTLSFKVEMDNVFEGAAEPVPFTKNLKKIIKNSSYGIKNEFPISLSTKLFKYFNFTSLFTYSEIWYPHYFIYNSQTNKSEKIKKISRLWDFQFSNKLGTNIYGFGEPAEKSKIKVFRHKISPTIKFVYKPEHKNYYQELEHLPSGDKKYFCKFEKSVYGCPGKDASAILSFDLTNNLEFKLKQTDEGEPYEPIPFIKSISIGTGYDFLAKAFKMQDIYFKIENDFFKKLSEVSFKVGLDPYINDGKKRIPKLALRKENRLGEISNVEFNLSLNINPASLKNLKNKNKQANNDIEVANGNEGEDHGSKTATDFSIPWKLNLRYIYNYQRQLPINKAYKASKSISFEGDLNITKKWKIAYTGNYDINNKKFNFIELSLNRDLHCWEMSFIWHPKIENMGFEFSLKVKEAILKHIKYRSKGKL
jgi:hypothetical protein